MLSTEIRQWGTRFGHLPWYRRYEFLFPALVVLLVAVGFFMPPEGRPEQFFDGATILLAFVSFLALVLIVITDREKPVLLKRAASLSLIALFFLLFYRYSGTQWDRVRHQFFNLQALEGVWPMYLTGLRFTLQLSVVAALASIGLGLVLGILRSLRNPVLELFIGFYIDFFRAMPLIVSMVVVFYALPFLGINLSAFWSAATSLILMNSAFQAEIFRAGIESIPKRQIEAAKALGLGPMKTMRLVVLPQATRIILPPLSNNLVSLVKDTAVAYVITYPELLTQARHAVIWKRNPTPLIFSMFIYLATLLPLTRYTRFLEKRSKRWVKR